MFVVVFYCYQVLKVLVLSLFHQKCHLFCSPSFSIIGLPVLIEQTAGQNIVVKTTDKFKTTKKHGGQRRKS